MRPLGNLDLPLSVKWERLASAQGSVLFLVWHQCVIFRQSLLEE